MKHFYTTVLVSLFIACNQLHASYLKISDLLSYAHAVAVEFEALSEKDIPQKENKLHQDVANLDRVAILGLINYRTSAL